MDTPENINYDEVFAVRNYLKEFYETNEKRVPTPQVIADALGMQTDKVVELLGAISYENDLIYFKCKASEVIENLFNLSKTNATAAEKYLQLIGWKPNADTGNGNQIIFKTYV